MFYSMGRNASFLLLVVNCWLVTSFPMAMGQDLSERDKSRIDRLDRMAESMDEVDVTKQTSSGNRLAEGRRHSEVSELTFRFLLCTSGLINDDKDGMLLFPMQISGFSSTLSPGSKPLRRTGSDLVEIRVVFKGLIGEETPQADIQLPEFDQGSTFPAADMVRDEIQKRIERFLPEVEILGRRRRSEKHLLIGNQTENTLNVFVHRRTNRLQENAYEWIWEPSDPGGRPQMLTIPPGKSELLKTGDEAELSIAQRVRIWAEDEHGQRWTDHHETDRWLVDENPEFDDDRVYYSEEIETFEHVFEPQPGPHVFTERVLKMKNESTESLTVVLDYRTTDDGQAAWRQVQFTIPANNYFEPKSDMGMRVRASRIRFSAESEDRRYETHQTDDLWLVDRSEGQRAYLADEIGEFQYVFLAAASGVDTAKVAASNVEVKAGSQVVGRVNRGEKYDVMEERGLWARIKFASNGKPATGWVLKEHLEMSRPNPKDTPGNSRQRFRATSNSADIKIGSTTIARIPPGREYNVLEENNGWIRVEVQLSGETRHGWVRKRDGVVGPSN